MMAPTTKFAHELDPGDEYAPLEFVVTKDMNQQFLFAQEDFDPRYLSSKEDSVAFVHPAILLQMAANTKSPSFKLAAGTGSILSEAETTFVKPVAIGTKLTVRWRVTTAYEKRGRRYYVMLAEMEDADGSLVLQRTLHLTFPGREAA